MEPLRDDSGLLTPPETPAVTSEKFQDRDWVHVSLFIATLASTTFVGALQYASYLEDFTVGRQLPLPFSELYLRGFWYSATILLILGCHEMGHYLACRYYNVDASLPFFIPMPLFVSGTLGAFIRIREPIPRKRMLFDIGIAGPIAGFVVAIPALFIGVAMSHVVKVPPDTQGLVELGEPLLFKAAAWLSWGSLPDGYSLNLHPMAFAGWFGLLATALNLFPIGQLDGGHIAYALLGRRSVYVTYVMVLVALGLAYFSSSWLIWTTLTIAMLVLFGPRHPRVADEEVPLDVSRVILALVALGIFVVCFTPAPISVAHILNP
ncbi:MAG TPA: site-2 protease family protein [Vicinamibacterales bacterium]